MPLLAYKYVLEMDLKDLDWMLKQLNWKPFEHLIGLLDI